MRQERLAYEYAAALFSLAREQKAVDAVYADLVDVSELLGGEKRIVTFMESPAISFDEKKSFVERVCRGSRLTGYFLLLAIRRKAFPLLPLIARQYRSLLEEANGKVPVSITSASPLDDKKRSAVVQKLNGLLQKTIVPEFTVDQSLVAGMVVRYGDTILDGSMKTQFAVLKEQLVKEQS